MSLAGILQALETGPMTEFELRVALGVQAESVRVGCIKLEERKQIHVTGYTKGRGPRRRIWALGQGSGVRPDKDAVIVVRGRRHVDEETGDKTTAREDEMVERAKVRGLTWWGAL